MRIGIDCRMYSSRFTGIGRYVFELTENIFELDKRNEYVLFMNDPEFSLFQPHQNVQKVLARAPHYSLAEQTVFLKTLLKMRLDLMHFTHFNAPVFYKKPLIVTIHDLTLSFFPGKKMNSPFHRAMYELTLKSGVKKAKKVITVSHNTQNDIQKLLKVPSEKLVVIYEGVNKKFQPLHGTQEIFKVKNMYHLDKPYILYTGVWRTHKNLPNLLEAFALLKSRYGFDGYLVITGRKDPVYAPEILKKTADLHLQKHVVFTDSVPEDDLVPLYNGAMLYVFPSFYEGFGLSPLEAMQCGVPVAASKTSCIPEICGEQNAAFFDPYDIQDMAQKLYQVLYDESLRKDLIQKGLQHVQKFSWRKMAEETLKVYAESMQ